MPAAYPSAYNTFIRDHDASNKMVVDFARNIAKFAVNKGDYALVKAGEAFGRGTRLKADADGKAVAIATTGTDRQNIGAVALESAGAAGELVPVQVLSMRDTRPALT